MPVEITRINVPDMGEALAAARKALDEKRLQLFAPVVGDRCKYRLEQDGKTYVCAIGAYLAEKGWYEPGWEGVNFNGLVGINKRGPVIEALAALQRTHDQGVDAIFMAQQYEKEPALVYRHARRQA